MWLHVASRGSVWLCVALCGSVWLCVTLCCSVWLCVALCGSLGSGELEVQIPTFPRCSLEPQIGPFSGEFWDGF